MAINDIVQTIAEARVDARSLSEFVFKPAGFKVARRLAPPVDTLQFYIDRFNSLNGDFSSSVSVALSSLNSSVAEADGKVAYIESTVQDAINNTAVDGGVLADTFVTATANNGTVPRTQREINSELVSIKSYGAIGDGTLHTVAEWTVIGSRIYYADLPAIQVDYPHVTSLSESIDWAATQQAAFKCNRVYAPEGGYVLNRVVKTPHKTSARSVGSSASGLHIFGDGVKTYFTRRDEGECTRIFNAEETSTTQESDTANSLEACFAVHCPYTNITDMTIMSSRLGIYMGQDFTQPFTSLSSATYSMFTNLSIYRCGTGILGLAAGGNHYIGLYNVNFYGCQIDYHLRASYWWKITKARGDANNNRHNFVKVRSDGSRVGYWNECGDTNTFYSWHAENLSSTSSNSPYPVPHHLPSDLPVGSCAFIFSGSNQLNKMTGCHAESCEWSLYNNGYKNSFFENGIKVVNSTIVQLPLVWSDALTYYGGGISTSADYAHGMTPETTLPGALHLGTDNITRVNVLAESIYHSPRTSMKKSYSREYQVEVGNIAANTDKSVQLWASIDANSCASMTIEAVGRCDVSGSVSSLTTKSVASMYRTSSRSISRFGIKKIYSLRANYEDFLEETETNHIKLKLVRNATNSLIMDIVISCALDLSGVTLFIKQNIQKI